MTLAPVSCDVAPAPAPAAGSPAAVVFESWPRILHSFSIVSHFHLLDLAQRPGFTPYFQPRRYLGAAWKPLNGVFAPEDWTLLEQIQAPPPDLMADVWIQMAFPYHFAPVPARRQVVFMACDAGHLTPGAIPDNRPLAAVQEESGAWIITPSHWSRRGLLELGAIPERTCVVPHGVDTRWFYPDPEQRQKVRKTLGWEGRRVLLSVGAMSGNKGIHHIVKAMAALLPRYPDLLLYLKGSDHTYKSGEALQSSLNTLRNHERRSLEGRIIYNGNPLTFEQVALLYKAADLYVSPYSAEGFNMPVLEAMACGLPVVCTAGGPTEDFMTPAAVKTVQSVPHPIPAESGIEADSYGRVLLITFDDLVAQMDAALGDETWRQQAHTAGAAWVADRYSWYHATSHLLRVCGLTP